MVSWPFCRVYDYKEVFENFLFCNKICWFMRFLSLAEKENTQSSFVRYAEKNKRSILFAFYLNALNASNVRLNIIKMAILICYPRYNWIVIFHLTLLTLWKVSVVRFWLRFFFASQLYFEFFHKFPKISRLSLDYRCQCHRWQLGKIS